MLEWALILRLTQEFLFIFTNYGLGLIGMNFSSYLLVSLPVLAFTACGYVLTIAGIFGGDGNIYGREPALLRLRSYWEGSSLNEGEEVQTELFNQEEDRSTVWSITGLTQAIRKSLQSDFPVVWKGRNLKSPGTEQADTDIFY